LALVKKRHINLTYAKPDHSNQMWKMNVEIRELKKAYHKNMAKRKVPKQLWSYGFGQSAKIMQILPRTNLNNRTPMESVTGNTPDIFEYLDFDFYFDFYDIVWYYPGVHPSISKDNRALGRWVGVSH
jgi:hypothetical protein